MESDESNYTTMEIPEGFVEIVNERGERGIRLKEADDRLKGKERNKDQEFLLVRVPGLLSALQQKPRMPLAALTILLLTVQRDRTRRKPLKINRSVAEQTGIARSTLLLGVDWLSENLKGQIQVERANGRATRITLTDDGKKTYHPSRWGPQR